MMYTQCDCMPFYGSVQPAASGHIVPARFACHWSGPSSSCHLAYRTPAVASRMQQHMQHYHATTPEQNTPTCTPTGMTTTLTTVSFRHRRRRRRRRVVVVVVSPSCRHTRIQKIRWPSQDSSVGGSYAIRTHPHSRALVVRRAVRSAVGYRTDFTLGYDTTTRLK